MSFEFEPRTAFGKPVLFTSFAGIFVGEVCLPGSGGYKARDGRSRYLLEHYSDTAPFIGRPLVYTDPVTAAQALLKAYDKDKEVSP